jgi:hypothetical protein
MAKTTAPLLGFGASGSIGDTLVYGNWRGVGYARRHVVPANPRSTGQTLTRDIFKNLSAMWKILPAGGQAPWLAFATGRPFLGVNRFMGDNVHVLRNVVPLTSMVTFIGSPGANGGVAATSMVAVGGALQIVATITPPAAPAGWTYAGSHGIAFKDQAPDDPLATGIQYQTSVANPGVLTFTGLDAATPYIVAGWISWTKPDASIAYSVGLTALEPTT